MQSFVALAAVARAGRTFSGTRRCPTCGFHLLTRAAARVLAMESPQPWSVCGP